MVIADVGERPFGSRVRRPVNTPALTGIAQPDQRSNWVSTSLDSFTPNGQLVRQWLEGLVLKTPRISLLLSRSDTIHHKPFIV